MPSFQLVQDFVLENFDNVKIKGNQITARCSLCGDSAKSKRKARFNLKYNDKETLWHCWNCGNSGNFYKLYALIKKIDINQAYNECESIEHTFNGFNSAIFYKRDIREDKPAEIPTANFNHILKDCFTEYNYPPGILNEVYIGTLREFRRTRCVSTNIPLFISYRGEYMGRIIIPIYDVGGNIIYFQARRTNEIDQPKYLNPVFPREAIIPNFDFFDGLNDIIITEGLLDCYSIDSKNVTCCLGKEIDDSFIERIRTKCKKIIIALDNDKEGINATLKIIKDSLYNGRMKYFIMPDKYKDIKDINELLVNMNGKNINMYSFIINHTYEHTKYLQRIGGL
jgi:5S rRNA maturation endonuclease (ribonuclease M5)